jgi:OOP family OmpA-OmpF porin
MNLSRVRARMTRGTIFGAGALALGMLALICIPRHLPTGHAALPAPSFNATLDNDQLTLSGSMAAEGSRSALETRAHELFKGSRIKIANQVHITDRVGTAEWASAAPALLTLLASLQGKSSIDIHDQSMTLHGAVLSADHKAKVMRELSAIAGPAYRLDDHLSVLPGANSSVSAGAAASPSRVAIQSALDDILRRESVAFESNSATITARGRSVLDKLAAIMRRAPDLSFEIGGHTDPFGDPQYNLQLSHKRAEAVRQYFVNRDLHNRFSAVGYGSTRPLSTDRTRASLQRNRRIELRVKEER